MMIRIPPNFLLVGNGPYTNRGCEAIVRGTVRILRHEFGNDVVITVASYGDPTDVAKQHVDETDKGIHHISLGVPGFKRFTPGWITLQLNRRLGMNLPGFHKPLLTPASSASIALQVGGDNYSLDYGLPVLFMQADRLLWSKQVPVVLWGASVGPFDKLPQFERLMARHLARMRAVFLRETVSRAYCEKLGLQNLYSVADPAFVMEPREPSPERLGFEMPDGCIGLNLSALMAHYTVNGDMSAWTAQCIEIVRHLMRNINRPVVLVPHVFQTGNNDYVLLKEITRTLQCENLYCVGDNLTAAELKWVISRCQVFAGARTHATIAAYSSCVPTLSFAYSIKARGICRDLYGDESLCIPATVLTPKLVTSKLVDLLDRRDVLHTHLNTTVPVAKERAFYAGALLRQFVDNR